MGIHDSFLIWVVPHISWRAPPCCFSDRFGMALLMVHRKGAHTPVDKKRDLDNMGSSAETEYAAFEERVKRTVYIDNLSPQVNEAILRTALDQFGNVTDVHFIPNYLESRMIAKCALVEMEQAKQAEAVVSEIANYPFMISGMPRPVRARAAEPEMFEDRPKKPGRKIHIRWLDPKDPDFKVAKELKEKNRIFAAEASFLLKQQLEEEEKLAKQQEETLKSNYKKYEVIDGVMADGTARDLARHYSISLADERDYS
ncbi:RNA recognition motif domain [Dillenia turbinata]|uniref:RNA recognition motif domain n=1 Tax=Dillenia turbinata TaxID=194707 RepID=A0AAN8VH33_9MAGN